MASKRSEVAQLNNIVCQYLERLGMSEEANLEFLSKANSMIRLESHRSIWFDRITAQLSQILHQIQQPRPEIDLNEPAPQDNKVEDDSHGRRKRVGSRPIPGNALRIRESKEEPSDMHNNQASLILRSDSD